MTGSPAEAGLPRWQPAPGLPPPPSSLRCWYPRCGWSTCRAWHSPGQYCAGGDVLGVAAGVGPCVVCAQVGGRRDHSWGADRRGAPADRGGGGGRGPWPGRVLAGAGAACGSRSPDAAGGGDPNGAVTARATVTASSGAYGVPRARSATSSPPASAPSSAAGTTLAGVCCGSASTTVASRNSPSEVAGISTASRLVCPASSRSACRPRWARKNPATTGRRPDRHTPSVSAAAARNPAIHAAVSPGWLTCRSSMRASKEGTARTSSAAVATGASAQRAGRWAAPRSSPAMTAASR